MDAYTARQLLAESDDQKKAFSDARRNVAQSVVEASRNIHFGEAESVPLRRMLYVLPSYQAAVTQALQAKDAADTKTMVSRGLEAHGYMEDVLLPAADDLDEANATALNGAYIDQTDAAGRIDTQVTVAAALLLACLIAAQSYLLKKFNRLLNPWLLAATFLMVGTMLYARHQFAAVTSNLAVAKESALPRVHTSWRAQARVEEAVATGLYRQLPGADSEVLRAEQQVAEDRVLTVPASLSMESFASQVEGGHPSPEPAGYLASLVQQAGPVDDRASVAATIRALSALHGSSRTLGGATKAMDSVLSHLQAVQQANQASFDEHSTAALAALSVVQPLAVGGGLVGMLLIVLGIRLRWNEYA
jgi:hypothetical protein